MIEMYLNSQNENLRFPIVPPEFGKNINADISTENIVKRGGISVFNGKEPDTISLSHFFPSERANYSYIDVKGVDPYEYVRKIEKWCKNGERLRFIITETPINMPVRINHFEYKEKDGSCDVYYVIELKEDEDIEIPLWTPPPPKASKSNKNNNKKGALDGFEVKSILHKYGKATNSARPGAKNTSSKIHTVKHGEYLYMIAQKYYGDGSKYKRITTNIENLKRYPSLRKSNVIYSNWKLVIP